MGISSKFYVMSPEGRRDKELTLSSTHEPRKHYKITMAEVLAKEVSSFGWASSAPFV